VARPTAHASHAAAAAVVAAALVVAAAAIVAAVLPEIVGLAVRERGAA
jgi:hypothetical protein